MGKPMMTCDKVSQCKVTDCPHRGPHEYCDECASWCGDLDGANSRECVMINDAAELYMENYNNILDEHVQTIRDVKWLTEMVHALEERVRVVEGERDATDAKLSAIKTKLQRYVSAEMLDDGTLTENGKAYDEALGVVENICD